jgi:uncharacterized damage-inducible protein DinB
MIGVDYVRRMARYNRWQNENLYGAADRLSDEERRRERGAFFGSIQKTFSHLLWADHYWMSRLRGTPWPSMTIAESTTLYPDWTLLKSERQTFDGEIMHWADGLDPSWLAGDHTYFSPTLGRETSGARWMYISHFFNHQTHHRGQVHCMLTQAGIRPADTDLPQTPV